MQAHRFMKAAIPGRGVAAQKSSGKLGTGQQDSRLVSPHPCPIDGVRLIGKECGHSEDLARIAQCWLYIRRSGEVVRKVQPSLEAALLEGMSHLFLGTVRRGLPILWLVEPGENQGVEAAGETLEFLKRGRLPHVEELQ